MLKLFNKKTKQTVVTVNPPADVQACIQALAKLTNTNAADWVVQQ